MRDKMKHAGVMGHEEDSGIRTAIDLWRLMGGRSERVRARQRLPDSMIAAYKDRVTYTFIMDDEVASIHFDRRRGEIFFKGHNIRNMELTEGQRTALHQMKEAMAGNKGASTLIPDYVATLDRLLADK